MDDLTQFLRDRLNDDETIAREAAHYEAGHWTTKGSYPVSVADELPKAADVFERVVAFDEGSPSEEQAAHIARHDPSRVLAEVAAKREIVGKHRRVTKRLTGSGGGTVEDCSLCDHFPAQYPCMTLRLLAVPYAAHPDYNEAWRP